MKNTLKIDAIYKRKNDYFVCEHIDEETQSYVFRDIKTGLATRVALGSIRYIGEKIDFIEYFV